MNDEAPKNLPSHIAFRIERDEHGKREWNEVGAVWPTRDGGLTVDMGAHGRLALRPRELLEKMREERKNQPKQETAPAIGPKQE